MYTFVSHQDSAAVCKKIMAIDPTELNFNIMALTGGQPLFWTACAQWTCQSLIRDLYLAAKIRSAASQTKKEKKMKQVWYHKNRLHIYTLQSGFEIRVGSVFNHWAQCPWSVPLETFKFLRTNTVVWPFMNFIEGLCMYVTYMYTHIPFLFQ